MMSGFIAIAMMVLSFGIPIGLMILILKARPVPSKLMVAAAILVGAAIFPLGLLLANHADTHVAWITFGGGLVLGWLTYSIRRTA
jgi:hypothetical protein